MVSLIVWETDCMFEQELEIRLADVRSNRRPESRATSSSGALLPVRWTLCCLLEGLGGCHVGGSTPERALNEAPKCGRQTTCAQLASLAAF